MSWYLEEQLVRERLDEVRAMGARQALVRGFQPVRHPVRVALGYALIRAGHWVAGRAPRRVHSNRVAAA